MSSLETSLIVAATGMFMTSMLGLGVFIIKTLNEQGRAITALQTQVSPLWAKVQAQIAADLHHPHPRYREMDGLLEKLEALTITPLERERLKILLLERSTDMHPDITESQRKAAKAMIPVMDLVIIEAKESNDTERTG